ncbi:MAG: FKBP-type peptidyl-prolyl cis-trans isomerase [Candidatus Saccharibacteria bacterium]
MSTTKTQRVVTLLLAIMFFGSTVGVAAYYVLANNDQQSQQADLQAQLQNQIDAQKTQPTVKQGENKLQGTKLTNYQPLPSIATLQISDTTPGSGNEVKAGDTVTVHYTGALAKDGTIFESSLDSGQTATFGLSEVIKGWTQGLPGMKVGGTRRLLIPASLAYGSQANAKIPANSDLVFDVQLIKIGK